MSFLRGKPGKTERTAHEDAADWMLREEAGRMSPADSVRLDQWLDKDPAHRSAWNDVRLAVDTASANAADPELMAMREVALSARGERDWGARGMIAAGLAVLVIGGIAAWGLRPAIVPASHDVGAVAQQFATTNPNIATYRTAVGERAAITLPDGSIATLDTDSALKIGYTTAERGVRLLRGQALFEVAKHKSIPFQVYAGDRRITAVGTRFNVRLDGGGPGAKVSVALLEGVVQVANVSPADHSAPAQVITMAAGEMLEARAKEPVRIISTDTDRLASWRSGQLTFDDAPLGSAVAEMNRYTNRPILLTDPKLAALRVSGVFRTGDPEHFAETMAEVFPIRIDHDSAGHPVLGPDAGAHGSARRKLPISGA